MDTPKNPSFFLPDHLHASSGVQHLVAADLSLKLGRATPQYPQLNSLERNGQWVTCWLRPDQLRQSPATSESSVNQPCETQLSSNTSSDLSQFRKLLRKVTYNVESTDEHSLSLVAAKTSRLGKNDGAAHAAAISIQQKFRGWKKRKEFLLIRQRIVKIQAHVRGHQVRKKYETIIWSVRTRIDQLYKAAELVQTGNPFIAQGILAQLNHQLSPIGKPFYRAAFYCKEALQLLLHTNHNLNPCTVNLSPFSRIFKSGAYKSFSEISPIVQFANFTCIQALLEALEGFDQIHIIDFDIGYGECWASFMQDLALRSGGAPSLRITAFASPSTHDQLELGLMRENLMHFASEINMAFEFEILSIDSLNSASWSLPLHVSENEAVAVNLPVSSFSCCQLSLPLILRFVKQLSPKIVVSVDRGCDRTDLPFPNHVIHVLQSYSNLLESLDAVNVNLDSLRKIERFLLQPGIERILLSRYSSPEQTPHWRTLFLSSGFSPLTFSNFTESQANCIVRRTTVRGFHIEKRQSSLILCWQRKELISASAWRC